MADTQKSTSSVWFHFIKSEKGRRCRYCQATISTTTGSTSNFHRHLKNKHPTIVVDHQYQSGESHDKSRFPISNICVDGEFQVSEAVKEPAWSAQLEPSSSIWEEFDADVSKLVAVQDPTAFADIEVDKYLAEPLLNRNFDPLVWWEERKTNFPNVYQLALKRLCIPATSVTSERIFSEAGQLCTEKSSRLTTLKLSKMLFINSNSYLL